MFKQTSQSKDVQTQNINEGLNKRSNEDDQTDIEITA
jgi:hypothetical protein